MRNLVTALIVGLILILVGGLLVVGISKVRASAARMSCYNNLHQLALTVHGYHDGNSHYPRATEPNNSLPPERRLSWCVGIIPWVEASDLYSRTDREKGWDAEENRFLALMVNRTLQCPG